MWRKNARKEARNYGNVHARKVAMKKVRKYARKVARNKASVYARKLAMK